MTRRYAISLHWPTVAPDIFWSKWFSINCWWFWYSVKVLHIRHNLFGGAETISLRLWANRHARFVGPPPFGGGVELGVGFGTPWQYSILDTICLLEPKLFLSPSEPIAIRVLWGTVPHLGEGVKLGGRVCYPVKVLNIRHDEFAGNRNSLVTWTNHGSSYSKNY